MVFFLFNAMEDNEGLTLRVGAADFKLVCKLMLMDD